MFSFIKNNKMSIGAIVVLLLGLYVYLNYFSGTSAPLSTAPDSVSAELLSTLGSLHTIRLDNSLFQDPSFVSLSDFGVTIPPQPSGRRNPFAPIGKGGAPVGTTTP